MKILDSNKLFLLEEIVKKDFSGKYKDSVLGILWSVLKPLLIMIILTIIFSTLFSRTIENFAVYYLAGKCIYDFFSLGTSEAMNSIKGNVNILKRTAAPKYIFTLGGITSEFLTFLITLAILVAVMIATKASFHITAIYAIIPVLCLIAMITGIGLMLSVLCVYFTDIKHLYSVIKIMLLYSSALFYPMDIIPEPYHQIMILNPLYWIIEQFRKLVLYGTMPDTLNIINTILLSSIILVIGIIIFKKYDKKITLRL